MDSGGSNSDQWLDAQGLILKVVCSEVLFTVALQARVVFGASDLKLRASAPAAPFAQLANTPSCLSNKIPVGKKVHQPAWVYKDTSYVTAARPGTPSFLSDSERHVGGIDREASLRATQASWAMLMCLRVPRDPKAIQDPHVVSPTVVNVVRCMFS